MINRLLGEAIRQSLLLHRARLYLIVHDRQFHESVTTIEMATLLPLGQVHRWLSLKHQDTVMEIVVHLQADREATETLMLANLPLDYHL